MTSYFDVDSYLRCEQPVLVPRPGTGRKGQFRRYGDRRPGDRRPVRDGRRRFWLPSEPRCLSSGFPDCGCNVPFSKGTGRRAGLACSKACGGGAQGARAGHSPDGISRTGPAGCSFSFGGRCRSRMPFWVRFTGQCSPWRWVLPRIWAGGRFSRGLFLAVIPRLMMTMMLSPAGIFLPGSRMVGCVASSGTKAHFR